MPSLSRLIGRFLGGWPFGSAAQTSIATPHPPQLPRPNTPVCIIGDVHGMADLLENLLAQIALQPCERQPRLIFVGDLIDRGPDSAAVLARVMGLCLHDPAHHFCLMGNHERMLLDALTGASLTADQIKGFERWLAVGGAETCDSFGVSSQMYRRPKGTAPAPDTQTLQTAQSLRNALGPTLLTWLHALPLYWQEADLAVCHAGADPRLPMADQDPDTLIWGPSAKRRAKARAPQLAIPQLDQRWPELDQRWVVHGHVIVPHLDLSGDLGTTGNSAPRHIAIDTGAYRTGRLSALWLDQNGARVIEATAR